MTVDFERSGGFAGITQRYSFSLEALPEEERNKVARLIATTNFFSLNPNSPPSPGADHFQYKITVTSDQGSHQILVDQGAVPPQLKPLIDWLQAAARASKRS